MYKKILALLPLLIIVFSLSANPLIFDNFNSKYKILLQSREFTPNIGLSSSYQNYINENSGLIRIHLLIQFNNILSNQEKINLESKGIKILDYIPNYAYLASVDMNTFL